MCVQERFCANGYRWAALAKEVPVSQLARISGQCCVGKVGEHWKFVICHELMNDFTY